MKSVKLLLSTGLLTTAAVMSAPAAMAASPPAITAGGMGARLATLQDPMANAIDSFGASVAVSGNTAVVGANNATVGNYGVGIAYVYTKGAAGWPTTPTQTLYDSAGATGDTFGNSVAISGNIIVIGTPGANSSRGIVFIYKRGATGWNPIRTLTDPGNGENDSFGDSVAISHGTVIVGAPYTAGAGGASQAGAAYLYTRGTTDWPNTPIATLQDPTGAVNSAFGWSTAISGSTVLVGAPSEDGQPGTSYIYTEGTAGWPATPSASLPDPAATAGDEFGYSAAVSGGNVVIGGYGKVAYIYTEGTGGWPTTPTVTLNDPVSNTHDWFGESVAAAGSKILIGAPSHSATGRSYAYVYAMGASGWPETPTAVLRHTTGTHLFGFSTALDATTAIVGEPNYGSAGPGDAFIYRI
jgi:FG-GAP repeat